MILESEADTRAFGARLAAKLRPGDIIALCGPLGAGKTSIARGLIEALGHDGDIPSPSFAIVQPYDMLDPPVWHVDLYRVENPDELQELGLESIESDGVLLVEWPERAGPQAFPNALRLTIMPDGPGRRLTAQVPAAWEDRWPLP